MATCDHANGEHKEYKPGQSRDRPLDVLSLGLMRTGTASMARALEILGYQHCAHGLDMLDQPQYVDRWYAAANAKFNGKGNLFTRSEWDELLGHCAAVTDMPCAMFWRELHDAYLDAKVILVERDEDKWYRSFVNAVVDVTFSPAARFNTYIVEPLLGTKLSPLTHTLLRNMFHASDAEGMKRNARPVYQQHYADIRKTILAEQRLDYQLGSGWKPLCDFLSKPVPDEEFPWVNETAELQKKIDEYVLKMRSQLQKVMVWRVLPATVIGGALLTVWFRSG